MSFLQVNGPTLYTSYNILEFNFEIPPFQRPLSEQHVNNIVNGIETKILHGKKPLLRAIESLYIISNGKYRYILIDGQHRYEAYRRLYAKGCKIPIYINFMNCENEEEMKEYYTTINSQLEHNDFELKGDISHLYTQIVNYLNEQPQFFSSVKCQRPKCNIGTFMSHFMKNSKVKTLDEFKQYIEYKNRVLSDRFARNPNLLNGFSNGTSTVIVKTKELGFYLGVDLNYSWMYE